MFCAAGRAPAACEGIQSVSSVLLLVAALHKHLVCVITGKITNPPQRFIKCNKVSRGQIIRLV